MLEMEHLVVAYLAWRLVGRSESLGLLPVSTLCSVLPVSVAPTVKLFPVCLAGRTSSLLAAAALVEMQHGTSFVSSSMTSLTPAASDSAGGAGWMLRNSSLSACEQQSHASEFTSHVYSHERFLGINFY